jgi:hypothetical protein
MDKNEMFLENKYTKWYYCIINQSLNRSLDEGIYIEKHHIIPKSLGGINRKDNLVILTAKEHFICHLLLVRMTEGKRKAKMVYAAWALANLKTDNQERVKITGKSYSILRESVSKQHAEWRTGQKHSEETKKKQRKPKTYEDGICPLKNVPRTKVVRSQISATLSGKSHSSDHTKKIAESRKIRTKYKWIHPQYGEIECTIWEIMEKYPELNKIGLRHVIYGYQKTHREWSIKNVN